MGGKKILFVCYNASRSGSSVLLLNLSKAISEVTGDKVAFIFRNGGELLDDFKKIGKVYCLNHGRRSLYKKILNQFTDVATDKVRKIISGDFDAVILNTVLNADLLPVIKKNYKGKIITYIHELKIAITSLINPGTLSALLKLTDIFLVPSITVQSLLITEYKISPSRINLLPYYIPLKSPEIDIENKPEKRFIVGGCGTVEMRKGTDLFVQLAYFFSHKYRHVKVDFRWLGGNGNSLEFRLLTEDIRKLRLENLQLQSSAEEVADFYKSLDVFVLTSREDPYPLVVLEAANFKVPSICFNNSGGATEFIEDNGKIVDYLDIEQLADAIYAYYVNRELRFRDGEKAKEKLFKYHQNKGEIVNTFFDLLK